MEAQIHRQQWRMPTVAVPEPASTAKACYLDGWRPGVDEYPFDSKEMMSAATSFRRQKGIPFKHQFFSKTLEDDRYQGQISTKNLGELAIDPSKGILNRKIAFIHVDGNNFGRIRRDCCGTEESRRNFDHSIQNDFRKDSFLKALLEMATKDANFQTQGSDKKPALRLEVLLWGGDEMTLVVPAWQGWRVMRLFYDKARTLHFESVPLSQRAAVIFCHHNAPILLIRQLAEDLLGVTKGDILTRLEESPRYTELNADARKQMKAQLSDHTLGDALHYLVLESFDLLRGDIKQFLGEYYKGGNYANLLIYANELDAVLKAIHTIQLSVSRGKALKIIEALQGKKTGDIKKISDEICRLLPREERRRVQDAIAALTLKQECLERWYLATDLWDYVAEGAIS
ncbi:MAG: hypothetical protein AB1345_08955 [Chloroflexota bacterium]